MTRRLYKLPTIGILTILWFCTLIDVSASQEAEWETNLPIAESTEIALYQSGRAIVQQVFAPTLKEGPGTLLWRAAPAPLLLDGFSATLDTGSIKSVTAGRRSPNASTFLSRAVGTEIDWLFEDGAKRIGRIISANPLLVDFDGVVYIAPDARPLLPRDLLDPLDHAALFSVETVKPGPAALLLRYQAEGLGWRADHIVEYDEERECISLSAGAILSNNTRTSYRNSALSLLAGQANRIQTPSPASAQPRLQAMTARAEIATVQDMAPPKEAGDLWRFILPTTTNLPSNSLRRVALSPKREFEVEQRYRLIITRPATRLDPTAPPLRPSTILTFVNTDISSDSLGSHLPIPAGNWRIYAKGDAPLVLGETQLGDITDGQSVTLPLGRAFDITAQALQTAYSPERKNAGYDAAYSVVLKNAKSRDVLVEVETAFPGQWTITETSHDMQKNGSGGAKWQIPVPQNSETTLTYQVTVRY